MYNALFSPLPQGVAICAALPKELRTKCPQIVQDTVFTRRNLALAAAEQRLAQLNINNQN